MYTSKNFKVRKEDEVIQEINVSACTFPGTRKFFLGDGNAMVLSSKRLLKILAVINEAFPNIQRISAYALPGDISSKSMEELITLREAGLKLIYVGIESGDDEVLRMVNKNETYDSTIEGLLKAKEAGIKSSVMILNGLGGLKYSEQHAINSAKIINLIQPEFVSTLVLTFACGIDRYIEKFKEVYVPMSITELLKEMEIFITHTELESTIFRSDHASNYLVLKGILSRDKQKFLTNIHSAIINPEVSELRKEWERGL